MNSLLLSIVHFSGPLAQSDASDGGNTSSIVFWSVILFVVVLLLFGGVVWARKRLAHDEDFHGEGFTLSDLRAMVKAGKLSEEEYAKAKEKMVDSMHKAQARSDAARAEAAKRGTM